MRLNAQVHGDTMVVSVGETRIDAMVAIRFKDGMRDLARDGPERVILDLAEVDFIDSSGLGAIVAVMKLLGPERRLDLAALSPNVEKVFRLTRMDRVFTIHDSAASSLSTGVA